MILESDRGTVTAPHQHLQTVQILYAHCFLNLKDKECTTTMHFRQNITVATAPPPRATATAQLQSVQTSRQDICTTLTAPPTPQTTTAQQQSM